MKDIEIVNHFLERNEYAISDLQNKYGSYCYSIANNILNNHEDTEECVNDTWNIAWNSIPPVIPISLKAFLGKIVRNQALIKYRTNHAQKRYSSMDSVLDELEEIIPSPSNIESEVDSKLLSDVINTWLGTLSKEDRDLFIRRYYMCDSVKSISQRVSFTPNKTAQKLLKTFSWTA